MASIVVAVSRALKMIPSSMAETLRDMAMAKHGPLGWPESGIRNEERATKDIEAVSIEKHGLPILAVETGEAPDAGTVEVKGQTLPEGQDDENIVCCFSETSIMA